MIKSDIVTDVTEKLEKVKELKILINEVANRNEELQKKYEIVH